MTQTKDPMEVLGIEHVVDAQGARTFSQFVGTDVVDHRGVPGMSSYATLAEIVGGNAFYRSHPEGSATVQARLSLSAPVPVTLGSRVRGIGRLVGANGDHGVTSAELADDSGAVICVATGRGVLVRRAIGEIPELELGRQAGASGDRRQSSLPERLDPDLTGRQILSGLSDGSIAAGPIQRLLGLRVIAVTGDAVQIAVTPSPGMANRMGTMHGGIVTSILAEACSLGAELSARAGGRYQLSDLTVSFLRSPAVDQGDLVVVVKQVKSGRRICSVTATMSHPDGTVVAQATADATAV